MIKRIIALGGALLMVLAVFTGCTKDELAFYNLSKEISQIKAYEATQKTVLSIELAEALIEDETTEIAADILKDITVEATYKSDNVNMEMEVDIDLTLQGEKLALGTFIVKDAIMYCPTAGMKALVEKYGEAEDMQEFLDTIGDADYITLDFNQDLGMSGMEALFEDYPGLMADTYLAMDKLIQEGFKDLSLGENVIRKTGGGYTFTLKDKEVGPMLLNLAEYSLENLEEIEESVLEFYNSDFAKMYVDAMNIPSMGHDEFIAALQMGFEELKDPAKKEELVQGLKSLETMMPVLDEAIEGSYVEYGIEKKSNGNYASEIDMAFHLTLEGEKQLAFAFQDTTVMKPVSGVKIEAPVGKTIGIGELLPETATMMIFVGTEEYFLTSGNLLQPEMEQGDMPLVISEDRVYLPLRQIGEAFGEDVRWDSEKKAAIVTTEDGIDHAFTGLAENGRAYVKIRDFEALGYELDWNGGAKIVTMIKKAA